jgi:peptidoglycan hydrolase CwlO-like protein
VESESGENWNQISYLKNGIYEINNDSRDLKSGNDSNQEDIADFKRITKTTRAKLKKQNKTSN